MRSKWSKKEVSVFLARLHAYSSSGLSLTESLKLCGHTSSKKERSTIEAITASAMQGMNISQALAMHIRMPSSALALISNGERSGNLSEALCIAGDLIERSEDLKKKVISAMTYPFVIFLFSSIMIVGIIKFILPQILPMLAGMNQDLPFITKVVVHTSHLFEEYGIYAVILLIMFIVTCTMLYRRINTFRFRIQSIFTRIPICGNIYVQFALSMTIRSLGSMVRSGVSLVHAYEEAVKATGPLPIRYELANRADMLEKGKALGHVIDMKYMPSYVAPIVHSGESSGKLGDSLGKAASIMDKDIEHTLRRMTSLIEPIMMISMGGVVGIIALSLIMPIYDMSKSLQ